MATVIKNIPFVGGDTATFEFDFGTKVVDSVAECPMRIYFIASSSIKNPTDAWSEVGADGNQTAIDTVKSLDGSPLSIRNSTSGNILQYMVMVDLSPLCASLFGGSNAAMVAALRGLTLNAWAMGYGSNSGAKTYACVMQLWSNDANSWGGLATNFHNYVDNITYSMTWTSGAGNNRINTSNKLYLLFNTYASDGTIPSEADLDYVNIKLQFARVPDVIAPIPITLPDTWSMLIKGFSPAWDSTQTNTKRIVTLYKDTSNLLALQYNGTGKFIINLKLSGTTTTIMTSATMSFNKWQIYSFLLQQSSTGLKLWILKNNSSLEILSSSSSFIFSNCSLSLLISELNLLQADAFLNSVVLLPNKTFDDDTEAEAVLRGTAEGFEEDELFNYDNLTDSYATHSVNGKAISINATAQYGNANEYISVFPNNKYHLAVDSITGSNAIMSIYFYYNNIKLKEQDFAGTPGAFSTDIIIPDKCNNIKFFLGSAASGANTVIFTNVSLKLKM